MRAGLGSYISGTEKVGEAMTIQVQVGREEFSFASYQDWVARAQDRFRSAGLLGHSHEYVCIDSAGWICTCGRNFRTAQYPVTVYLIDPATAEDLSQNPPCSSGKP